VSTLKLMTTAERVHDHDHSSGDCPACFDNMLARRLRDHFGFMRGSKTRSRFRHQVERSIYLPLINRGWLSERLHCAGYALDVTDAGRAALGGDK
jgi:hypothetical protein